MALVLLIGLSVGPASASETPVDPTPPSQAAQEKAAANFDQRIENVRGAKDCIAQAKTKSEIQACRNHVQLRGTAH
jgi:hypothetical protein